MKATGIVRRIDDLGRVVIPKEIRRTLRIREGDPLEIYTDNTGQVILKKYSLVGELSAFAKEYAESLAQTSGHITCISDKDQIIAISGAPKKEFLDKNISRHLEKVIEGRNIVKARKEESKFVPILSETNNSEYYSEIIAPIISEGDAIGSVIFLSMDQNSQMGEVEEKLVQSASGFLGKQMEQ
ncbi:MAG: stage V sporulation protein T [Epulopiscium sp. Nuni2H_MBin003]|nr:MAG: stage V sporulation protein T [Epulopiscium sp. Nuni2H_MBin003]